MESFVFAIYLIIFAFAPIFFGAVHSYAYTFLSLCVLFAAFLLVVKNLEKTPGKQEYRIRLLRSNFYFLFFIFLFFLFFQMVSLPNALLGYFAPKSAFLAQHSLPASAIGTETIGNENLFSPAPYRHPVRMSLVRFSVYGLFFLGLIQVLNSRKRIEKAVFLILIVCCLESLYGISQAYSNDGHILWLKKTDKGVSGTYINRNHFAGLMTMGVLLSVAFSMALGEKRKRRKSASGKRFGTSFFKNLLQGYDSKRALVLIWGVVIGLGLLLSASRGGIISASGGLVCLMLLFFFKKGGRGRSLAVVLFAIFTFVYGTYIGVSHVFKRFDHFFSAFEVRERYARNTLDMLGDYQWSGVGVGNFQYAYPAYQSAQDKQLFVRFAHNDWAQFLSEAGIVGCVLLFAGMSYYLYRSLRLWRRRNYSFAVCLGVLPIPVFVAMGIHSLSDFNLHIPANFLMLTAVAAIGHSALHLRRGHEGMIYRHHVMNLKYKGGIVLFMLLAFLAWNGYGAIRHFMAEIHCNTVHNSTLLRDRNPSAESIAKAISWDKWNAEYHYKMAKEKMRLRDIQGEDGQTEEIISCLETAVRLNPFQAHYHLWLGWEYARMGNDPAFHEKWLPAADLSMKRVAYFAGSRSPGVYRELGRYWTMRAETRRSGLEKLADREKAREYHARANELEKIRG